MRKSNIMKCVKRGLGLLAVMAYAGAGSAAEELTMGKNPETARGDIKTGLLVFTGPREKRIDASLVPTGDRTPDFSFCGFMASEEPIPWIEAVETLEPLPAEEAEPSGSMAYADGPDSHQRIQAALDRVAAMEANEKGFRGAVFLSKGTYYVNGGLTVRPGVVLRGEGQRGFGTTLIFSNPQQAGITGVGSRIGVEGLNVTSNYDRSITSEFQSDDGPYEADEENNLAIGIHIQNSENAWVRGCRVQHASSSAVAITNSRHITVRNSLSIQPVSVIREGRRQAFSIQNSSRVLVYDCFAEMGWQDFVAEPGDTEAIAFVKNRSENRKGPGQLPQSRESGILFDAMDIEGGESNPEDPGSLFEQQLVERIGKKEAYISLTETLSKASIPMKISFPISIADDARQDEAPPEQTAFEKANQREWTEVMSDTGNGDWTEQWFLDGEGSTTVTNTPEGMELNALDDHMVLWTRESFEGDLKIEYEFTLIDMDGGGVCIIYIQATGRGDAGYEKDITKWNDYREEPGMGKYFQHMHLFHISYACGYVRGRRYMPDIRKMNTFTELTPEYVVDQEEFFEPGTPYKITIIKTGDELCMRAVGADKKLYFTLKNEKCPPITEGRIGLRQMQTRHSRYADFKVSLPE